MKDEELLAVIQNLHGKINGLEARYEDSKKFVYKQLAELAKDVDKVKNVDVHYKIVHLP